MAAFLWGVSAVLGRAVFTGKLALNGELLHPIDPIILSQTRTSFSLLVLLPLLVGRRGWRRIKLPATDLIQCLMLGMFGVAASNYFYYVAIQRTSVAIAIIVQYTAPVWVLLYLVVRGVQRATAQRVMAVALAVVGAALAIGLFSRAQIRASAAGIVASLGAAFSFAFQTVYGHDILSKNPRWKVMLYSLVGATLFWLVLNPPNRIVASHYSGQQWLFLLVFAITSMLLPITFFFSGLQYLDATRAIVTSCLEPIFAILCAALALHEGLSWVQVMGVGIVLAATVLVQLPERSRLPVTQSSRK
jgi:drug/metabolite transporter (DMT)-like permease